MPESSQKYPQVGDFVEIRHRERGKTYRGWLRRTDPVWQLLVTNGHNYYFHTDKWVIACSSSPPCGHCWEASAAHVNGKCLFLPTEYRPATEDDALARRRKNEEGDR